MDDTGRVGMRQTIGHLSQDRHDVGDRQRAAGQPVLDGFAGAVRQGDEWHRLPLANFVDRRLQRLGVGRTLVKRQRRRKVRKASTASPSSPTPTLLVAIRRQRTL